MKYVKFFLRFVQLNMCVAISTFLHLIKIFLYHFTSYNIVVMSLKFFSKNDYAIAKKLFEIVENHVKVHDYCFVTKRIKFDSTTNYIKYIVLMYDRDDEFKLLNNFKRIRKINNIKCDCFFLTRVTYYKNTKI